MYDLGNSRALRGGERSRGERNTVKPRTDIVTKGRWRLAEPMYDVGCTMYNTHDGPKQLRGSCSCTIYDVRCTIAKFARVARGRAKPERTGYGETVHGHSYKGAVALGRAYVRCTMYDLGNSRALRGDF